MLKNDTLGYRKQRKLKSRVDFQSVKIIGGGVKSATNMSDTRYYFKNFINNSTNTHFLDPCLSFFEIFVQIHQRDKRKLSSIDTINWPFLS